MNRLVFRIAAAILTTGLVTAAHAVEPLAKDINWVSDLSNARTKAVQTGRPMLIVFGAEWCTYCKKLEATTLSHPQMVKHINSQFVPVHLDYDEDRKIAKILEVEQLPCSVVLSPEADLLGKFTGFKTTTKYYQELSEAKRVQAEIRQASNTTTTTR